MASIIITEWIANVGAQLSNGSIGPGPGAYRRWSLGPLLLGIGIACTSKEPGVPDIFPGAGDLLLEETSRLGSADDPDKGFLQVQAVAEDEAGLVYVLDATECVVSVFDATGALLHRLGGKGDGPGEFRRPVAIGVIGDTLWVSDLSLRRITLYSRTGPEVWSVSPPYVSVVVSHGIEVRLLPGELRRDGLITSRWAIPIPRAAQRDSFSIPDVRMDREGNIVDTLLLERWATPPREVVRVGGFPVPVPPPLTFAPIYVVSEQGAYVIERPLAATVASAEFRVTRTTGRYDTLYSRTFRYRPRRIAKDFLESLVKAAASPQIRLRGLDSMAVTNSVRNAIRLPAFQQAISSAHVGEDGSLYLRGQDDGGGNVPWLLLTPGGEPRGTVALPKLAKVMWSRGSVLWVAITDEDDVPWVVGYDIRGADEPTVGADVAERPIGR